VDELVPENREEKRLDAGVFTEASQSFEEGDERVLHQILGLVLAGQTGAGEGQEPALIARHQLRPSLGVAARDLVEKISIRLCKLGHRAFYRFTWTAGR